MLLASATERRARSEPALCALILISAVWLTFGGLLHADFVYWDDQVNVFENPYLHPLTPAHIGHFWTHGYEDLYIPLSYMLFALLVSAARLPHPDPAITATGALLNPHVFHAANLTLHTLNVLLVFAILRLVVIRLAVRPRPEIGTPNDTPPCTLHSSLFTLNSSNGPALIGALLFALHPLQVESVAWITEMRGLLSEFFCLAAMYAYLTAVTVSSARAPLREPPYWLAMFLFACALLSKPAAATLPLALLALDRFAIRRPLRSIATSIAPLLILVLPFAYITHRVQTMPAKIVSLWWTRPVIAGDALAFYLWKLFAPTGLAIDYGRNPPLVLSHWWGYATWLLPLLAAVTLYRSRRKNPLAAAGGLTSVALLLPVLGFIPFSFQGYSTVGDRYAYLAMLGPSLVLAGLIARLTIPSWPNPEPAVPTTAVVAPSQDGGGVPWGAGRNLRLIFAVYAMCTVALGALAAASALQARRWMNTDSLFSSEVRVNPKRYRMLLAYGLTLIDQGRLDEAVTELGKSIRAHPVNTDAYASLVSIYHEQGRGDEARDALVTWAAQAPKDAHVHLDLGLMDLAQGNAAAGADQIRDALRLQPKYPRAEAAYANALLMLGRTDDAVREFQATLRDDPAQHDALVGLGSVLVRLGRADEAETYFRRAMSAH